MKRRFRLIDGMVLVAATAIALAIFRQGMAGGIGFTSETRPASKPFASSLATR